MRNVTRILGIALFAICFIGAFLACNNVRKAQKMTPSMANYVYAYTGGSISPDGAVRVRLTMPVVAADKVGSELSSSLFSLTPSVSGKAVWEDTQTIRFTPDKEGFSRKREYLARVALSKFYQGVPSDASAFEFNFRTREPSFAVVMEGLDAENGSDPSKQNVLGEIVTTEPADSKKVEALLTAQQNGDKPVVWSHAPDGLHHIFRVKDVFRGNESGNVSVKYDGKSLDVEKDGTEKMVIPSIGEFRPTNVRVVQDGDDQYIKAWFSDPLSVGQELSGLVRFVDLESYSNEPDTTAAATTNAPKFSIEGNCLKIYPARRLSGSKSITFSEAIRNSKGQKMSSPQTFTLSFSEMKPSVRLLGRGSILPDSEGLLFPFEAVNLRSVTVEVFKIYNNNILEFFKYNELNSRYYGGLQSVGNVILQKKIALNDLNPNAHVQVWARYALDLSKLIKADPQAIYQVRIGFNKSDANLACRQADANDANMMKVADSSNPDSPNFMSITDNEWYGERNYDEEYNYNDPCGDHYYSSNRVQSSMIIPSNIGIIAKRGGDGSMFMVVSDLRTTEPRKNVKLEIFDQQSQLITSLNTGGDGIARFEPLKSKPYIVIATEPSGQRGYLPLSDGNTLSLSRFDVAGVAPQHGLKGYLYGERGVWRPGDSLYLNFILEDKTAQLPENFPITMELYDPRGVLTQRVTTMSNVRNLYPLHTATRPDAPTGTWRADVKVGGATFSEAIKIENVKPNRLKINLDLPKGEIRKGNENFAANMQINWLHGAPARGVKAKVEAVITPIETSWKGKHKGFVFDCPVRSFKEDPQVLFENAVSESGVATVNFKLPETTQAAGKLRIALKLRAFEESGAFSSDYRAIDYSPYKSYAGVEIPKNKYGEKRFDIGKKGTVRVLSVDPDGNPLSGRKLNVTVYRMEWRWWWENNSDESSEFSSARNLTKVYETTVNTGGGGFSDVNFKTERWGRYMVYVSDPESDHATGDFVYTGYPWDEDEEGSQSRNNAAMLNFSTDKDNYKVGETVEINVPTGDGKMLVSIENGSKVLSSEWIVTKSGMTTYKFKTTPEMSPTVYAFVTMVQPHQHKGNDLPIRMYGVAPVEVENPATKLEPIVKMPDVVKPDEKISIEVTEKTGKAMAYTVAIVDDGLLDLTRFKTPDPHGSFYAREALGVQTFDGYDQVLGAFGGKFDRILSVGGDKANKPRNSQRANRFKPVVHHLGPFLLGGGKTARHTVEISNYFGSVRAMVVAADGKNSTYGSTEKTVAVRKPLMVLSTLPRVLAPGEQVKLPVDVFAMEAKVNNVNITVQESSGLVNIAKNTQSLSFEKTPTEKMANFDLVVGQKVGIAKFKITATGGGETATEEIEIEVKNPNPVVTTVKQNVLAAGQTYNEQFAPIGTAGSNKVTVEVSSIPPIDMARRLSYLLQYPHGCVEQATSSAFPQIYAAKLLNLTDQQKATAYENVKAAIDKLRNYQTGMGTFGYWQGDALGDDWATSYVGHFLVEAKNWGYTLPPNMLDRWLKAQQMVARRWIAPVKTAQMANYTGGGADLMQAYRLYTLALAKAPEMGAMNLLKEKTDLSLQARWRLAAAYALANKADVAKQLINGVATEVAPYRELSETFGSNLRDEAMILETLSMLKDGRSWQVAQQVSRGLSGDGWYATQSVAYGLIAMARFVGDQNIGGGYSFQYDLNGKTATVNANTPIFQIQMTEAAAYKIKINNTSKQQIFVRIISQGQPSTNAAPIAANAASGLQMQIAYKTIKGEALNVSRIVQGTDFVAEVTIKNGTIGNRNLKELALTQTFAAGWEILNPRLDGIEGFKNTAKPDYQDIRDDRVMSYFDLPFGKQSTFRVRMTAAYVGKYYLPMSICEAMYDNSFTTQQGGTWVEVVGDSKSSM